MSTLLSDVAIVGAGLGGCALALALSARSVSVTLYEARAKGADGIASGVVLTPNGLRILDKLGVLPRIRSRCYQTVHRVFKDDNDETLMKTLIAGQALTGYANHRVWRHVLLDEMKQMLADQSVEIHYEAKVSGILSDHPAGVTFETNGMPRKATILIASDGIYSTVRSSVAPGIEPQYVGLAAVISHVRRSSVAWPHPDYERNATIQGRNGAMFFIPEDAEATDIMVAKQIRYSEASLQGSKRLQDDKDRLVALLRDGYDEWGATAKSLIDAASANKASFFIWPYMKMPKLERWYSTTGRVVLVGDAAHALPPSSGQGVNQVLEDIYSLTLLLCALEDNGSLGNSLDGPKSAPALLNTLAFWQEMRQSKINAILDWATNVNDVSRLPIAERERLVKEDRAERETTGDDMRWLYLRTIEEETQGWIDSLVCHSIVGDRQARSATPTA